MRTGFRETHGPVFRARESPPDSKEIHNVFVRTAPTGAWPDLGLPSVVLTIDGLPFHDRLSETYASMADAVWDPLAGRGPNDMNVTMQQEGTLCDMTGEQLPNLWTPEFG